MATALFPGAFIALYGALGAGKTAFVRGVAAKLGIEGICSPTFTIVQEHAGTLPLYHFDAYRLQCGEELCDIGFEDYLYKNGIIMLEWPENIKEILPDARLDIHIEGSGEESRTLSWLAHDEKHAALLEAILKEGA